MVMGCLVTVYCVKLKGILIRVTKVFVFRCKGTVHVAEVSCGSGVGAAGKALCQAAAGY